MKQRESNLKKIIFKNFQEESSSKYSYSSNDLSIEAQEEMLKVYQSLGGILNIPPTKFGAWDIITNNFIVELDEEQHFNRYRAKTLQSSIYEKCKLFSAENYIQYCQNHEQACLKKASYGKYWTNPSTEKQFGIAGLKGDFSQNGSTRWKQRAFYDYCRDIFAKEFNFKLYRFAIYDMVKTSNGNISFGKALELNLVKEIEDFLTISMNGK